MRMILMILAIEVLTSCAHATAHNTFKLAAGMDERDVKDIMGDPETVFHDRKTDTVRYMYDIGNGFGFDHPYVVLFKKGRLVRMSYARESGNTNMRIDGYIHDPNTMPFAPAIYMQQPGWGSRPY